MPDIIGTNHDKTIGRTLEVTELSATFYKIK